MKKILPYAEYMIYILWLNIATFVLRPMTWSVLSLDFRSDTFIGVSETVSNLLIYLITVLCLACFFKAQNQLITYRDFFSLLIKRALLPVFVIRLSADIIKALLSLKPYLLSSVAVLLTEAIALYFTFYFIKKAIVPEKTITVNRAAFIIIAVLLLITVVFYASYYISAQQIVKEIIAKYKDCSFLSYEQAFGLQSELINILFGILLWTGLFIYFGLFKQYAENKEGSYRVGVLAARIICLFIVTALFAVVKMFLIPQGTLGTVGNRSISSTTYTEEKKLEADYSILELSRIDDRKQKTVYKKTTVYIRYLNLNILKFKRKANAESGILYSDKLPSSEVFYRYDFDAVAYISEDGSVKAMLTEDINSYRQKDENIISYMEYLIEEGYFEAFEYSYKYLIKYDAEFIEPYIDKSASDYFCGNPKNSYLNTGYMKNFISSCTVG